MSTSPLKIVFHGQNAANFRQGFEQLVAPEHQILDLSDALDQPGERAHYETADEHVMLARYDEKMQPLGRSLLAERPS